MLLLTRRCRILGAVAIMVGMLGFAAAALLPKPVAAALADVGVGVFPEHNGRAGFACGSIATPGFARGSIATPGFARGGIATPGFARGGIATPGLARRSIATPGFARGGFAGPSMMRGGGR